MKSEATQSESLKPGTMVTPNIRLEKPLGRGAMASVWTAEHLGLGTQVAVKFISPHLVPSDTELVQRFKREASVTAKLTSPFIVRMFDHGVMADDSPYLVMELLEGESLAQRLERTEVLSLRETEQLIKQVARGLGQAHKLGIVHRDLKPENLFLVDSGLTESDDESSSDELFVKILDFGVAKQHPVGNRKDPNCAALTSTGELLGTPVYMSPEQIEGMKTVDFRSDLWALGVVAYECITGQLPFIGETIGAIFIAAAFGNYQPPSELLPGIAPELDEWFERVLQRDPKARFRSMQEMVKAFSQAIDGAQLHRQSRSTAAVHQETDDSSATGVDETPVSSATAHRLMQRLPLGLAQLMAAAAFIAVVLAVTVIVISHRNDKRIAINSDLASCHSASGQVRHECTEIPVLLGPFSLGQTIGTSPAHHTEQTLDDTNPTADVIPRPLAR